MLVRSKECAVRADTLVLESYRSMVVKAGCIDQPYDSVD